MRILMMTNTYFPIVGGIEESIHSFAEEFTRLGHKVLIVAPQFEGAPRTEPGVLRLPAIQKFQRTEYSVHLPILGPLMRSVQNFKPDIVHSQHPFLIGDMALRLSRQRQIPLVFTYHTMYEDYIDYLPVHGDIFKRFIVELAAGYANLCDQVIVPSRAVARILRSRGVAAPLAVIPTGIKLSRWARGARAGFRRRFGIGSADFVVGHVGRISPEKNIRFLLTAAAEFLRTAPRAHFLMVGQGPAAQEAVEIFHRAGVGSRFHAAGVLQGKKLVDAYHAMDVFTFASHSETQGLVLLEAMACGIPVVAVDDPIVDEAVVDQRNGKLVGGDKLGNFVSALRWIAALPADRLRRMKEAGRETAAKFSQGSCARRMLAVYDDARSRFVFPPDRHNIWSGVLHRFKGEAELLRNIVDAGETAMKETLLKKNRIRKHQESVSR